MGEGGDALLAQELDALWREGVVVPLPRELRLDVALRGERLERLDNLEVRNVEVFMLGCVVIFLGD